MRTIKLILLFLMASVSCLCQTRLTPDIEFEPRVGYELGSGGTQFSNKRPDRHGLLQSQYTGQHHLVGVYAEGAYSMMFNNCEAAYMTPGGGGVAAGAVYEFQDYVLRIQTGVGVQYQQVANKVLDMSWSDHNVTDAFGYPYHLHYSFYNRTDYAYNTYIQVPFLIGANYYGWYFLGGVKAGIQFWGATKIKAIGTTTGTYDQFIGIYEEMDNHGLRKDVEMVRRGEMMSLKPSIYASLELGYESGEIYKGITGFDAPKEKDYRIKVAFFADFGINNVRQSSDKLAISIPTAYKWDFPAFGMSHTLGSNLDALPALWQLGDRRADEVSSTASPTSKQENTLDLRGVNNFFVRNVFVGVRVTFLIGFHSKEKCIICGPYRSERGYL